VQHHLSVHADLLVQQELADVRSLVARQLNDLAQLVVLDDGAVAAEVFLEGLEDALHVQVIRQTLHRRQTLAAVTLLHTHVDLAAADARVVLGVGEGVYTAFKNMAAISVHRAASTLHLRARLKALLAPLSRTEGLKVLDVGHAC